MNALLNSFDTYGPLLLKGTLATLGLWSASSCLSALVGFSTGIARSRPLRLRYISPLLDLLTFFLRAVPLYVQVLFVYFAIPEFFALNLSSWFSGIIALGVCSGSYVSEIVRNGIEAVPAGQWEASFTLGYTRYQQFRYVILPQALPLVAPLLLNEYNMVLKSTALLSSIGAFELTKVGMNIATRSFDPFPIFGAIALIYVILVSILSIATRYLEEKFVAW